MKTNAKSSGYFTGLGYWTRANPELCLLATRGSPKRLNRDVRRLVVAPRREHSRKPAEIRERIERLVAGPYAELFARETCPGWDAFGDEIGMFAAEPDLRPARHVRGGRGMKPKTFSGDLAALPAALRPLTEHKRWIVWKWKQKANGKWTKPPHRADDPSALASSSDPSTWASYTAALAAVTAGVGDGIGYVLTRANGLANGIGALDLDDCRDPDTGAISPWAQELVDETASYVETTVSGTGLRIIGLVDGADLHTKMPADDGGSNRVLSRRHAIHHGQRLADQRRQRAAKHRRAARPHLREIWRRSRRRR